MRELFYSEAVGFVPVEGFADPNKDWYVLAFPGVDQYERVHVAGSDTTYSKSMYVEHEDKVAMGTKIVIGDPPLGEQTHPVVVGKLRSGDTVIQTDNGWITIKKEDIEGTADALLAVLE